jgi:hypothetical protein
MEQISLAMTILDPIHLFRIKTQFLNAQATVRMLQVSLLRKRIVLGLPALLRVSL